MKIVGVSDLHNHRVELPEGDLLLIAGDLTATGSRQELVDFNEYLEKQSPKFKHKPVVIAGNHDFYLQRGKEDPAGILDAATYLQDELLEIDGLKIYGSPWTLTFMNMAFMKDRGEEISDTWKKIPEGIDVLLTHGPPGGILDQCPAGSVGCFDLLRVLTKELKAPPKVHIFGHIHEGYGRQKEENTEFFNVSVCTVRYKPNNAPTVIEL